MKTTKLTRTLGLTGILILYAFGMWALWAILLPSNHDAPIQHLNRHNPVNQTLFQIGLNHPNYGDAGLLGTAGTIPVLILFIWIATLPKNPTSRLTTNLYAGIFVAVTCATWYGITDLVEKSNAQTNALEYTAKMQYIMGHDFTVTSGYNWDDPQGYSLVAPPQDLPAGAPYHHVPSNISGNIWVDISLAETAQLSKALLASNNPNLVAAAEKLNDPKQVIHNTW